MLKFVLEVLFSGANTETKKNNDIDFTPFTHQNGATGKFGSGCEAGDMKLPKGKL